MWYCERCGAYHDTSTCPVPVVVSGAAEISLIPEARSIDRQQEIIDKLDRIIDLLEKRGKRRPSGSTQMAGSGGTRAFP